jgi:hypothetical protein
MFNDARLLRGDVGGRDGNFLHKRPLALLVAPLPLCARCPALPAATCPAPSFAPRLSFPATQLPACRGPAENVLKGVCADCIARDLPPPTLPARSSFSSSFSATLVPSSPRPTGLRPSPWRGKRMRSVMRTPRVQFARMRPRELLLRGSKRGCAGDICGTHACGGRLVCAQAGALYGIRKP